MGMLDANDLKQIGGLLDERFLKVDEKFLKLDEKLLMMEDRIVSRIVEDVGEAFEQNFLPMVDELIDEKLAPIKTDIVGIKATMVTKDYLDEKMVDLKGDLIAYDRKLEKKTDTLVDALIERRTLTASDVERIEQVRVFPRAAR